VDGGFSEIREPEEVPLEPLPIYRENHYKPIPDAKQEIEAVCQYEVIDASPRIKPRQTYKIPRPSSPPPPILSVGAVSTQSRLSCEKLDKSLKRRLRHSWTRLLIRTSGATRSPKKQAALRSGPTFMSIKKAKSQTEVSMVHITLAKLKDLV
jgi:hypothetical protein